MDRIRRWWKAILAMACAGLALGGAWGAWVSYRYPTVPDLVRVDLKDAFVFMGTDDFQRMFESHRRRYALALADRLRDKSLEELLIMTHDPRDLEARRRIVASIRHLPNSEEFSFKAMGIIADKLYQQPEIKRKVYLTVIALALEGEIGRHPDQYMLIDPTNFQGNMARFVSSQSPRTQAQFGQFLHDIERQRETLGLKEPVFVQRWFRTGQ
jgi:hypothetical protein